MPKNRSLIAAYLLDGKGGGEKIDWQGIKQWSPDKGILWVHLDYTVHQTEKWLINSSGLDKLTAKAMLADETRPRCVINTEGLLIFLRGVNLNPGEDPEDMVSIRLWISKNYIITTRKRKLLSVGDLCQAIDDGIGPKTSAEFFRMLNDRLLDRMSNVIELVDDQVDELEQEVITAESHLLRPRIADLRRQSILIRRYLAPQREALNRLSHSDTILLPLEERAYIREANDRIIRYIEDLDSARERASITQEELTSRLSEQLDKRMYILSLVAVVFLPLSFITGLLGINVGGIPGAQNQWSFLIVSVILTIILLFMLWLFHKKKWV